MKSLTKTILSCAILIATSLPSMADGGGILVVKRTNGVTNNFPLTDTPVIKFSENSFTIKSKTGGDTYPYKIVNSLVFVSQGSGDANGDGMVDITDVTSIIDHILGRTPAKFSLSEADVNGDGKVDITDVTSVIDIILNKK